MHEKHTDQPYSHTPRPSPPHRPPPPSPRQAITMLKGMTNHEYVKTSKHEAPRSTNHKTTQNKNNTGTSALERSAAQTIGAGVGG